MDVITTKNNNNLKIKTINYLENNEKVFFEKEIENFYEEEFLNEEVFLNNNLLIYCLVNNFDEFKAFVKMLNKTTITTENDEEIINEVNMSDEEILTILNTINTELLTNKYYVLTKNNTSFLLKYNLMQNI